MCLRAVKIRFFFLLAFMSLLPTFGTAQQAANHCMPFAGERLTFGVGWEFINAGIADMHVETDASGYRVISHGTSNKVLDVFHKVRDTIISTGVCQQGKLQSTRFDVEQHEGHYNSSKQVQLLWQKNKATYSQNDKTDSYDVEAGHLNAIDAFFRVRKMQLKPGMQIRIPVFDSRKKYELVVKVVKRVKLRAPWGKRVQCLLIIPKLKTKGIFSSKGTVKLWLTDDARHIPLKMTAKIKLGRIIARLNKYTPPSVLQTSAQRQ